MKRLRIAFLIFVVALLIAWAGPGSSWAEEDEAPWRGIDAFHSASPPVRVDGAGLSPEQTKENVFFRECPSGEAQPMALAAEGGACLISRARLNLSNEPVILHVPDFGSRSYLALLEDSRANTITSLGTAFTGNEARDFVLVGPQWTGDLPAGLTVIESPTEAASISVRLFSSGAAEDIAAVYALQDGMSLTPLTLYAQPAAAAVGGEGPSSRMCEAASPAESNGEVAADRVDTKDSLSVENEILLRPEAGGSEVDFDISEDIQRGREFLKDKAAGYSRVLEKKRVTFFDKKGRRRERLVSRTIIRPHFLLAVEDLRERKLRQVLITDRGCVTEGFRVIRTRNNGVASRFEVTYPENMAVLALRTTVRSGEGGLKEVIYTPYSPEIDTRQVRKAGLDYLVGRIKLARSELAAKKVRLAEFLETGDSMPMEVSLVLSIIEHIDPVKFEHYQGNETALVHEVLTIIGANTTEAYSYSKSPAGARGLFQFVPDTYKRLAGRYRRAGLKKDFVLGCTDHVNAAKASLLLFDSDLASLPRKVRSAARKDGRSIGRYLAAAYNCGPKRVERSARACKDQWTCLLPEETRVYLKKFDAVWNLRKILDK